MRITKELRQAQDLSLHSRAKLVSQYVENTVFYIKWARYGRDLPDLEITDPRDPQKRIAYFEDLKDAGRNDRAWLTDMCLRALRGLDTVCHSSPGPSTAERLGWVFKEFRIDGGTSGSRHGPGEAKYFKLARYRTWEKLRGLGDRLLRRRLVTRFQGGSLEWSPACDIFCDMQWSSVNGLPMPATTSQYPEAPPPGHLLAHLGASGLDLEADEDDGDTM